MSDWTEISPAEVKELRDDIAAMRAEMQALDVRVRQVLALVQHSHRAAAASGSMLPIHRDPDTAAIARAREVNRAIRLNTPFPHEPSRLA